MPTYRDGNTWRTALRRKVRRMVREGQSQSWKIARYMELQAKINAPADSGQLRKSVRKVKRKNGYTVSAGYYNRGFPVAAWVNRDIKAEWLDGVKSVQPFFRIGTTGRYGDSFVTPAGKSVDWDARGESKKIGFWNHSLKSTYRKFGKGQVIQALRTKLRT